MEAIGPDRLKEVGLFLLTEDREENGWDSGHLLGSFLLLHYPNVTRSGKG